jgi:hypothetical protein
MSQERKSSKKEEMRAEYDIRGGVRENTTSGTGKGRMWYCLSQTGGCLPQLAISEPSPSYAH